MSFCGKGGELAVCGQRTGKPAAPPAAGRNPPRAARPAPGAARRRKPARPLRSPQSALGRRRGAARARPCAPGRGRRCRTARRQWRGGKRGRRAAVLARVNTNARESRRLRRNDISRAFGCVLKRVQNRRSPLRAARAGAVVTIRTPAAALCAPPKWHSALQALRRAADSPRRRTASLPASARAGFGVSEKTLEDPNGAPMEPGPRVTPSGPAPAAAAPAPRAGGGPRGAARRAHGARRTARP